MARLERIQKRLCREKKCPSLPTHYVLATDGVVVGEYCQSHGSVLVQNINEADTREPRHSHHASLVE